MAEAHARANVTITVGQPLSGAANISSRVRRASLVGIIVPATFDGTALTFQASNDGDDASPTYFNVFDANGNEVTITTAASRWVALDPADFAGMGWIKLRAGTAAAPTNQTTTDTVLTLIYRTVE